jgi:hypothetical protein
VIRSDCDGFALTSKRQRANWRIRSDKDDPSSELPVYGMNQEGVLGPSRHALTPRFVKGETLCWAKSESDQADKVIATWVGNH